MTTQNREAVQARLGQAQNEAEAALAAATDALETAQLQAVAMNIPVPGALVDAVDAARRRVNECEGAIAAFARQGNAEEVEAQRKARAAREKSVDAGAETVRSAAFDLIAAVDRLMSQGEGAKLLAALGELKQRCGGASINVLGPAGWESSDHLRTLFVWDHDAIVTDLIKKSLVNHYGVGRAQEYAQTFASQISDQIKAQPAEWPAA